MNLRQNWDKLLLGSAVLFTAVSVVYMIVNLYGTSSGIEMSLKNPVTESAFLPISHEKYETLEKGLKDLYVAEDVHKRNIFSSEAADALTTRNKLAGNLADTGKNNNLLFSEMSERLCVMKIYRKPVELMFKGYMQMGDGTYVATINWGGKTDFKKINDEIRGYKITNFRKDVSESKTLWGGTETVDKSVIILEKSAGEKIELEIGKLTLEKEIYAEMRDRKETKNYEAYIGSEILGNKVLDINSSEVIISTQDGGKISLKKETT